MASIPSKGDIAGSAGKVADEAESAARETAKLAKINTEKAADAIDDLYARVADETHDASNEVPATFSDVAATGERLALRGRQALDHGVRKQPVEALLLAGAIGYLVGWAASRG